MGEGFSPHLAPPLLPYHPAQDLAVRLVHPVVPGALGRRAEKMDGGKQSVAAAGLGYAEVAALDDGQAQLVVQMVDEAPGRK